MTELVPYIPEIKPKEGAEPKTTPPAWDSWRVQTGKNFEAWMKEAGYSQLGLACDMSFKPYKSRKNGVSSEWVSDLMNAELDRAPLPLDILSIACLTGHLFDPFLVDLGKALYYRLDVPVGRGLKDTYMDIWLHQKGDERLVQLVHFFEQLRKVMEQ
jgi:hypothetical protein